MAEPLAPLSLDNDHWRSRWLVDGRWNALHRIAVIEWDDDEMISGRGTRGQPDLFNMECEGMCGV